MLNPLSSVKFCRTMLAAIAGADWPDAQHPALVFHFEEAGKGTIRLW
jgi:hypothetical protein